MPDPATLTQRFAEWSSRLGAVPDDVRGAARWHVLDALGTGLAAARLGAVDFAVEEAMGYGTPPEASILGYRTRHPAPMAALANGTLIHALDFDDTHAAAILHGSAAVLPSVLAVSEVVDATLDTAVDAYVVGVEMAVRVGAAATRKFHNRGFHATSVVGIFGATLAASRLLRLDPSATVNALGIAGSQAAGSLEFLSTASLTKPLHPGWAGLSAVMAARMAARGATGPSSILEGKWGVYRAYADTTVDAGGVTTGLGESWEATQMTTKPYPVCQYSHATLDTLGLLPDDLDTGRIGRIDIGLPRDSLVVVAEPRESRLRPRTTHEAKFSVQWNVATMLLDGYLGVDHFTEEQLGRKDVRRLAAKVFVHRRAFDGSLAEAPGDVTITLDDGTTISRTVTSGSATPGRPVDEGALLDKFLSNVAGSVENPEGIAKLVIEDGALPVAELMSMTSRS
ncbi:MAG: MmgE/PrpD family protein [bacterium]|nr:MmgE/PrpD family protein [bacterium]MDE0288707.1 MmgE/PrpD family protein [bacterium]MDE0437973.1 MmgE/PrpD family protein [bacterium]